MRNNILSKIYPYRIIRDVILVNMVVGVGFVFAFAYAGAMFHGDVNGILAAVFLGSIIIVFTLPVAFLIVGVINSRNRWFHLAIVTIIFFTEASLINGFDLSRGYFYFVCYVVGGLLSMLFRNREKDEKKIEALEKEGTEE